MGDKTGIEWTDATWNPLAGCSIVSPACTNCYAMKMAARIEAMSYGGSAPKSHYEGLTQPSKAGPVWTGKVVLAPDHILTAPLRWKRPRRIFVNSMSDLFHESVPDEWIDRIFAVMALAPQHIFQVLTKRAKRMREYFAGDPWGDNGVAQRVRDAAIDFWGVEWIAKLKGAGVTQWPVPNVWLGVTAEDQTRADERCDDLVATPATKRFVSYEPALGPLDLRKWMRDLCPNCLNPECVPTLRADSAEVFSKCGKFVFETPKPPIDWVIAGGESGPNARPSHPDWFRSLRDHCAAAGVPFFFKQWGEWAPASSHGYHRRSANCRYGEFHTPDGEWVESCLCKEGGKDAQMLRVGKACAGSFLDNRKHKEFPQ